MFKKIMILIFIFIAGLLLYATTRPETYFIKRSVTIKAPPEKIFNYINDLKKWPLWFSGQGVKSQGLQIRYSGAADGKGSRYHYEGNLFAGSGKVEIIESLKASKVVVDLDMQKPFGSRHGFVFTLEPDREGTRVAWLMIHRNNYIAKVIHIFVPIDPFIGKNFEQGLENLKIVSEK